jgi:hypothetical protein
MVLKLQVKIILAENALQFKRIFSRALKISRKYHFRYKAGKAGGEADKPLAVSAKKLHIDARLCVKPFCVGKRYHLAEVFIANLVFAEQYEVVARIILCARFISAGAVCDVYLAPDDGLDALFFACLIEIHRAEHCAVVCYRNGAVPHGGGDFRYFGNTARTVEQAVFRVKMQVNEWHGFSSFQLSLVSLCCS